MSDLNPNFGHPPLSCEWKEGITEQLRAMPEVFSFHDLDISCTGNVKHQINLHDEASFKHWARPIHPQDVEAVCRHLAELLEAAVIQESPSPFSSSIVVVRKKNNDIRLCIIQDSGVDGCLGVSLSATLCYLVCVLCFLLPIACHLQTLGVFLRFWLEQQWLSIGSAEDTLWQIRWTNCCYSSQKTRTLEDLYYLYGNLSCTLPSPYDYWLEVWILPDWDAGRRQS